MKNVASEMAKGDAYDGLGSVVLFVEDR